MNTSYVRRRSSVPARRRSGSDGRTAYKQAMARNTLVCAVILGATLMAKSSALWENKFAVNSLRLALTQTTDFRQYISGVKEFFTEQVRLTGLMNSAADFDPVRDMIAPVKSPVDSHFGLRIHPVDKTERFHYGVDIPAAVGEKIACAADGEVSEVGADEELGNYIIVRHSEKISSYYGHCADILPKQGDRVKSGQLIATAGDSGKANTPHLHFEIRDGESSLDPEAFIRFGE